METLADSVARDIHEVSLFEYILDNEALARLESIDGLKAELLEVAHRDGAGLLKVAQLGLSELPVADTPVPHLYGIVPVGCSALHLGDDVALAEADDGYWDDSTIRFEVRHHAELCSHDADACLHAHDRHSSTAAEGSGGKRAEKGGEGGAGVEEGRTG